MVFGKNYLSFLEESRSENVSSKDKLRLTSLKAPDTNGLNRGSRQKLQSSPVKQFHNRQQQTPLSSYSQKIKRQGLDPLQDSTLNRQVPTQPNSTSKLAITRPQPTVSIQRREITSNHGRSFSATSSNTSDTFSSSKQSFPVEKCRERTEVVDYKEPQLMPRLYDGEKSCKVSVCEKENQSFALSLLSEARSMRESAMYSGDWGSDGF